MIVGILSGAVTNTPGLGAAQQAYSDMHGEMDNMSALGYAIAYSLGVVGIIFSIIFIRFVFRISFEKETDRLNQEDNTHVDEPHSVSLVVKNLAIFGKKVCEVSVLIGNHIQRWFYLDWIWCNNNDGSFINDRYNRVRLL